MIYGFPHLLHFHNWPNLDLLLCCYELMLQLVRLLSFHCRRYCYTLWPCILLSLLDICSNLDRRRTLMSDDWLLFCGSSVTCILLGKMMTICVLFHSYSFNQSLHSWMLVQWHDGWQHDIYSFELYICVFIFLSWATTSCDCDGLR